MLSSSIARGATEYFIVNLKCNCNYTYANSFSDNKPLGPVRGSLRECLFRPPPTPPPFCSKAAFSRAISSWNSRSSASLGSSLIFGLFFMFFARLAYLSTCPVSGHVVLTLPILRTVQNIFFCMERNKKAMFQIW